MPRVPHQIRKPIENVLDVADLQKAEEDREEARATELPTTGEADADIHD